MVVLVGRRSTTHTRPTHDPRHTTHDPPPTTHDHDPRRTTHDPRPTTTHDPLPTTHDRQPTAHDPRPTTYARRPTHNHYPHDPRPRTTHGHVQRPTTHVPRSRPKTHDTSMAAEDGRRITEDNSQRRDGDRRRNFARARREFTASINSCDGVSGVEINSTVPSVTPRVTPRQQSD